MKYILFDIDGTLVDGWKSGHAESFNIAIEKVFNIKIDVRKTSVPGMVDKEIIYKALIKKRICKDEILKKINKIINYAIIEYKNVKKIVPTYPSVKKTLEILKKNYLLGLSTGNVKKIAFAKLAIPKLEKYFSFGGFGDDGFTRKEVFAKGKKRAENLGGTIGFVVGDTPSDIESGKANGLITIGVKTNYDKLDADYMVDDFKEIVDIVEKY
ncbi:MAG: HAD family hydrolase [Candidatus Woesearchaeota archaeon]